MKPCQAIRGPQNVVLWLDRNEIYPDDPGQGTPALVTYNGHSASYWCAADTGEVDDMPLPSQAASWLRSERIEQIVDDFFSKGTDR